MGSPGSVPSSLLAFGRPPPLGAGPPAPPCPAPPAGAVLPRTSSPRALESGPPEATDLLGAQRLSGYPAGARLMAAARGAAAKTNRSTRSPTAPRSEAPEPPRGPAEHHTAGARLARLRPGPARPRGAQPGAPSPPCPVPLGPPLAPRPRPRPPADRQPGRLGRAGGCAPGSRRVSPPPPRAPWSGGGVATPARHLPSSLSSTIISGAPCPAAARLGREKGADAGRASAGRPVLGRAASGL